MRIPRIKKRQTPKNQKASNKRRLRIVAASQLVAATGLAFGAMVLSELIAADVQYGLSLPLSDMGVSQFTVFLGIFPWLSIALTLAVSSLAYYLLWRAVRYYQFHEERLRSRRHINILHVTISLLAAITLLAQTTQLDNKTANLGQLDRLRSFEVFSDQFIVEGIVQDVDEGIVTITDSEGDTYVIDTRNTDSPEDEVTPGDTIAILLPKPKDEIKEGVTEGEPIPVVIETPILLDPELPPPPSEIDPGPSPEPDTTPGPNPIPEPDPDPTGPPETSTATPIVVRALGRTGTEIIELQINNQVVKTWPLSASYQSLTYQHDEMPGNKDIRIEFTNNGPSVNGLNPDVRVDYIKVDGTVFQTESSSVYSTGTWRSQDGCSAGYKSSEWLNCSGYFEYSIGGDSSSEPTPTTPPSSSVTIDASDVVALVDPSVDIRNWTGINQTQTAGMISSYPNLSLPVKRNGQNRIGAVSDPHQQCGQSLELVINKNDPDTATTGAKRAELRYKDVAPQDMDVWQTIRMSIGNMAGAQDQQLVMQWPNTEAGGVGWGINPALAFYLNAGKFSITHRHNARAEASNATNTTKVSYTDNNYPFDVWVEYVLNIRFDPDGNGKLVIWRDGERIVNYSGGLGYKESTPVNLKLGFYHYGSHTYNPFSTHATKYMYVDHMAIIQDADRQYSYADLKNYMDNKAPCN